MGEILFNKDNFDKINYINFSDDFEVKLDEKSKIIFAPNGTGKTSLYNYIKSTFSDYKYIDYENIKDDFIKNKKEIVIGTNIIQYNEINYKILEILNKYDLSKLIKKYIKKAELKKIDKELSEKIDNNHFLIESFSNENFNYLRELEDADVIFLLKNYNILINIILLEEDTKHL